MDYFWRINLEKQLLHCCPLPRYFTIVKTIRSLTLQLILRNLSNYLPVLYILSRSSQLIFPSWRQECYFIHLRRPPTLRTLHSFTHSFKLYRLISNDVLGNWLDAGNIKLNYPQNSHICDGSQRHLCFHWDFPCPAQYLELSI